MNKHIFSLIPFSLMLSATLVGCSDKSEPKSSATADLPKVVPLATKSASLNVVIDFSKSPFPDFVADARGVANPEVWGRWSDGDRVSIKFNNPLPRAFNLEVTVRAAFGPNANAPVRVLVGNVEKTLSVTKPDETFSLDFELTQDIYTLEIIPPHPTSPKSLKMNEDNRMLGIGLSKIRIVAK